MAINGCCYGKDNIYVATGDYYKYCGQKFWEFISGNPNLYIDIIEPLAHKAKEKNEEFYESYAQMINKFTLQFGTEFCDDGIINWARIVEFNSSIKAPKIPKAPKDKKSKAAKKKK